MGEEDIQHFRDRIPQVSPSSHLYYCPGGAPGRLDNSRQQYRPLHQPPDVHCQVPGLSPLHTSSCCTNPTLSRKLLPNILFFFTIQILTSTLHPFPTTKFSQSVQASTLALKVAQVNCLFVSLCIFLGASGECKRFSATA